MSGIRSGGAPGWRSKWRAERRSVLLRPFLNDAGSCASYRFGCTTHGKLAVVDPHTDLVDDYLAAAAGIGAPITAVFETHVQADHFSGLPALVEQTVATAYLRKLLELPDHVVVSATERRGECQLMSTSMFNF